MPSTKSYRLLHDQIAARPGAAKRLTELRMATSAEVRLYRHREALCRPPAEAVLEAT